MILTGHQLRRIGAVLALTLSWTGPGLAGAPLVQQGEDTASTRVTGAPVLTESDTSSTRAEAGGESAADTVGGSVSRDTIVAVGETPELSYPLIMLKLGLALALVILLAWGAMFVLRRSRLGQQYSADSSAMRVLDRLYLGPHKQICLIMVGDRTLAVGVADQQITALADWAAGEVSLPPSPGRGEGFAGQLRRLMGTGAGDEAAGEGGRG